MKIEDGFDSNFRYVLVAARRARQLQNGSQPLVSSRSTKACRVAQDEIAAGKVKFVQPDEPKQPITDLNFPVNAAF
ncbi:MAG TPA: DNA-directed RNA polymerase subunit omega [Acidobacteriaceae bacterium]|nr:DNA-directed RNA polymerase subunit omega [Acidobacteriaceae bacterium]